MKLLAIFHKRMGDLWWYAILLFVAQRFGDLVNMFVGLWFVPKFVPQQDLGAVLPLTQAVSLVGLPLGILAIPFMKFLNVYAANGEYGKIKSLLRDVLWGTAALAIVTLLLAWGILPFFFVRVRVAAGSLGLLIVSGCVLTAISTIFGNAVQGLKLFRATVWFNLLGAPFRLLTMAVLMPFRALSGYFAGQCASPSISILGAVWVLRKRFSRKIQARPYWHEDGSAIIRYTIPIAVWTVVTTVVSSIESLVIRHRLSDFESAGYYLVTRFTDISIYFGSTFIIFLFPLVAGMTAKSGESRKILIQSMVGTAAGGLLVGVLLAVCGDWILSLQSIWETYAPMSGIMFPICVLNVLIMVANCLVTYEMAQGRFRFFWYVIPILIVRCGFLYSVTGMSYFGGILPESIVSTVISWNPCRLSFIVTALVVGQVAVLVGLILDVFSKGSARS